MNRIREYYYKFKIVTWLNRKKRPLKNLPNGKKCFVFLAADYGNLGDVAITYAQEKFLREQIPDYEIIDVPISETLHSLEQIKQSITEEDIVTIVGGGNIGDLYFDIELLRLLVVKTFTKNRIIVFPQTANYSDSSEATYLKKISKKIYCTHPNLTMCAREVVSFNVMKKEYPEARVLLMPDIVMTLNERCPIENRSGVIFCLRNDKEKADNSNIINQIREFCMVNSIPICNRDTHIGRGQLSLDERTAELKSIWCDFRKSKFVVTDRLHGMIFSYITGTPAIVLPNSNLKIEKCYEWIKRCGYIFFMSQNASLEDAAMYLSCQNRIDIHEMILGNFEQLLK